MYNDSKGVFVLLINESPSDLIEEENDEDSETQSLGDPTHINNAPDNLM